MDLHSSHPSLARGSLPRYHPRPATPPLMSEPFVLPLGKQRLAEVREYDSWISGFAFWDFSCVFFLNILLLLSSKDHVTYFGIFFCLAVKPLSLPSEIQSTHFGIE